MKRSLIAIVVSLLTATAALGGQKEMERALGRWQQQVAEYQAAYKLAATDAQREALPQPDPDEIAPALWKAISAQSGTRNEVVHAPRKKGQRATTQTRKVKAYEFEQEWAAPAVAWFMNYPRAFAKLFADSPAVQASYADALLDAVLRVHYASPLMQDVCPALATASSEKAHEIAEKVYTQNTSPNARATAALTLSIMLANPAFAAAEGGEARARSKRIHYLKQALTLASDDTMYGSRLLTEAAAEQSYRLRHLSNGAIAQQFSVHAADGSSVLFPVQGRPNLIFFWSDKEEVGLSLMSKQASLLSQYPGLVLCPIVMHGDSEQWQRMCSENGIDTCYMDDEKGAAGLLYRVSVIPTAVLLNERSRIVYIGYPDRQLQTALDDLFSGSAKQKASVPATAPKATPAAAGSAAPALRPMQRR